MEVQDELAKSQVHTSPFGVIPKKNTNRENGGSFSIFLPRVNNGIEKELSSITYVSINELTRMYVSLDDEGHMKFT